MTDFLEEVRKIRNLKEPKLKPSPFLKQTYIDDIEEEKPIIVRDYQKIGMLNLCTSINTLLSDDTGLGKSLQVIGTIGYVRMVEPNYLPIVVTTKSSLLQWKSEIKKFSHFEPVVAYDEPIQRHKIYEEFFNNWGPEKNQILIMTYDSLLRDISASTVREKLKGKEAKNLKEEFKIVKTNFDQIKAEYDDSSINIRQLFDSSSFAVQQYFALRMRGQNSDLPSDWSNFYEETLKTFIERKNEFMTVKSKFETLRVQVNPVRQVPGFIDYIKNIKSNIPGSEFFLVMDEMHRLKNHKSKIHEACKELSLHCKRIYGLTATPVQNKLMEFFSLFRIIEPKLFPKITHFMNEYCVTKMQHIGGGRQVPIVVGYKNLDKFIQKIEPYYLSRKKHEVAKELPQLITKEIICELSDVQEELYDLAELGVLSTDADAEQAEVLKSLTLCQQAVNSPTLIADEEGNPFEGPSSKEDTTLELLENELSGRKVIIFSRFERMVSRLGVLLDKAKIPYVRITGKESKAEQREEAKLKFQNPKSGFNVILITEAGSESIDLYAAEFLIFFDTCFSWGKYVQLVGRAVRIGSKNENVTAIHLIGQRQNGDKTIDNHVIKLLRTKKNLSDKVAGKNLPDALKFSGSDVLDIFSEMRKGKKAGDKGTLLAESKKLISSKKKKPSDVNVLTLDDI